MLCPATMPTARVMNRISGMVMVTIEAARQPRNAMSSNTTVPMPMAKCSMSVFTASLARCPSLRVTLMVTESGITLPRRRSSFRVTSSATDTAFMPPRLASASVTAPVSISAGGSPVKAGP